MTPEISKIYLASRSYWNTRYNDIHVPLSTDFAYQLLLAYPEANRDVVIPAILMHDNGWKTLTAEQQAQAFGPNMTREDLRRQHEIEGTRIADEILTTLDYDRDLQVEILEIIDGHDSRLEALSLNDQLVKDADKIWRFTPIGLDIDHRRFGKTMADYLPFMQEQCRTIMFTKTAQQIAQNLLDLSYEAHLP